MKQSEVDISLNHDGRKHHFHSSSEPESQNLVATWPVYLYKVANLCPWACIPMAQTLCICLLWMYEVVWGRYRPQPWHHSIISTSPVNLNPQIWGHGRFKGIWVHRYAIEIAYKWLKHFLYVLYGCMKWSDEDFSLNYDVLASFSLLKWTWIPKSGANLAGVMV